MVFRNDFLRFKALIILTLCINPIMFAHAVAAELQTEQINLVPVPQVYRLDGIVEAVNQSTLSAQTSGQVTEIFFDVEDYVEKGSLILTLKDTAQKAQLDKARANFKGAAAQLQDASREFKRTTEIFAKKLASKKDMDKADAALKSARAQHQAAQAALDQAREQLSYTKVTAPFPGIVTERHIEIGEIAQPGTPLISGISLDKLRVNVNVPQTLISAVRRNGEALVKQPNSGWVKSEKITIFPFAEPTANTFKVRLDLPPGIDGLFPGMFVKTAFITDVNNALVVPRNCVVYRSEVVGVYVVDDSGKITFRHVRLGNEVVKGNKLMVISGLDKGEKVALDPISAGTLLKEQRKHGRETSHE